MDGRTKCPLIPLGKGGSRPPVASPRQAAPACVLCRRRAGKRTPVPPCRAAAKAPALRRREGPSRGLPPCTQDQHFRRWTTIRGLAPEPAPVIEPAIDEGCAPSTAPAASLLDPDQCSATGDGQPLRLDAAPVFRTGNRRAAPEAFLPARPLIAIRRKRTQVLQGPDD